MAGCAQIKNAEFLSGTTPKPSNALAVVSMADGAVALTPPPDYCIDKSSLKPRFALMARCDVLGAESDTDASLALITVTLVPLDVGAEVPNSADLAAAIEPDTILQTSDTDGLALVQTKSATGLEGVSERHWRGVFVVNGILVGLALYGPPGGQANGNAGGPILSALAKRTIAQTKAQTSPQLVARSATNFAFDLAVFGNEN